MRLESNPAVTCQEFIRLADLASYHPSKQNPASAGRWFPRACVTQNRQILNHAANGHTPKKGLDQTALERLREVIRPDHPENPWQPDVQYRNGLMVLTLWALGIRRGELLAL